jgi:hypothetical protein
MRRALARWRAAVWSLATFLVVLPLLVHLAGNTGVVVWCLGVAVLGPLWLRSHPGRDCPGCSRQVKHGFLVCGRCGYELLSAASLVTPAQRLRR